MPAEAPLWRGLRWVLLAGLALRLAFVFSGVNFSYPDEIYQYLEQAHRLVFGYGVVPWEFRYGTRSWLLPFAIAVPLYLCKWLGVDTPVFYVPLVYSLLCLFSLTLVYSCYVIARRVVSERAGQMAAVGACAWYELIYYAPRALSECVSGVMGLLALALALRRGCAFWVGLLLGLAFFLRMQYGPALALAGLIAWREYDRRGRVLLAVSLAVAVAIAGLADKVMWGGWFVSYINNYDFNVTQGVSRLFGVYAWWFSGWKLLTASLGLWALAVAGAACYWRRLWIVLLGLGLVLVPVSLFGHQEYRFSFAAIPLLVVLFCCVADCARIAGGMRWLAVFAVVFMAADVVGAINPLTRERDNFYTHSPVFAPENRYEAFPLLYGDPSLKAVYFDWWWAQQGGYYFLHRNVPIFFNNTDPNVADITAYVSHVVCSKDKPEIEGFMTTEWLNRVQIRSRKLPGDVKVIEGRDNYDFRVDMVENNFGVPANIRQPSGLRRH